MNLTGSGVLATGAIVAAGLVGLYLYRNRESFNPASDQNIAHQSVSAGVAAITGGAAAGGEDTLGGVFARAREWISGDDAAIEAMKAGSPVKPDGSLVSVYEYESDFFYGAP